MKRSGQVGLVLLTALGLSSCGRSTPPPQRTVTAEPPPAASSQATMTWDNKPRDPCAQQYFDEGLCQSAIHNRGFHYGGSWIPMMYSYPYTHYYGTHQTFMSSGGSYTATPVEVYHPSFKAPATGAVVKGGFGTTAAAIHSGASSSGATSSGATSSGAKSGASSSGATTGSAKAGS